MLRVLLVDDGQPALDGLNDLLKQDKNVEVIEVLNDLKKAPKKIRLCKPDAVFIGINMPEISALILADEIREIDEGIDVIFITEYNKYAVEALELNAIDYILKPVGRDRLNMTIKRLLARRSENIRADKPATSRINAMNTYVRNNTEKIMIWDGEEMLFLKASDILYLTSIEGSTLIATRKGKFKVRDSLDTWEASLSDMGFFRCHRCSIVNVLHIDRITPKFGSSYIIKLEDIPDEIPLSRNRMKELKKIFSS